MNTVSRLVSIVLIVVIASAVLLATPTNVSASKPQAPWYCKFYSNASGCWTARAKVYAKHSDYLYLWVSTSMGRLKITASVYRRVTVGRA